jgi:hypothetical protein
MIELGAVCDFNDTIARRALESTLADNLTGLLQTSHEAVHP